MRAAPTGPGGLCARRVVGHYGGLEACSWWCSSCRCRSVTCSVLRRGQLAVGSTVPARDGRPGACGGCPGDRCGHDGDAPVSQARMAELNAGDTRTHAHGEPDRQCRGYHRQRIAPGDEGGQHCGDDGGCSGGHQGHSIARREPDRRGGAAQTGGEHARERHSQARPDTAQRRPAPVSCVRTTGDQLAMLLIPNAELSFSCLFGPDGKPVNAYLTNLAWPEPSWHQ